VIRLIPGTDHLITLPRARALTTGAYINTATVTAQVVTVAGVALATPIIVTLASASALGDYTGTLLAATVDSLDEGRLYGLQFVFAGGVGLNRTANYPLKKVAA